MCFFKKRILQLGQITENRLKIPIPKRKHILARTDISYKTIFELTDGEIQYLHDKEHLKKKNS